MPAAWEWRGFQPAGETLLQAVAGTARLLDLPPPTAVLRESDCYLVAPGLAHNLKFRQGALELKRLHRQAGEYSLWVDKERWPLPLSDRQIEHLRHLLGLASWKAPSSLASTEALFTELRRHVPALSMVALAKQRVRFDVGQARLEVACLTTPEGTCWLSFCADGYELSEVKELVARVRPLGDFRAMSYVNFLQATVEGILPVRGVQVLHGKPAP